MDLQPRSSENVEGTYELLATEGADLNLYIHVTAHRNRFIFK
jgi:hypothetical protein